MVLREAQAGWSDPPGLALLAAAADAGWPAVYELRAGVDVEADLLDGVSGLGSGTRALGVFEQRWGAVTGRLCVALCGVRDPGNVGGPPITSGPMT